MIVWGGYLPGRGELQTGARYDPIANRWRSMSAENAPSARAEHCAVWTGKEMLVWGGLKQVLNNVSTGDGGRYDPENDTWYPITTTGAPSARRGHTAVWTGREMIVWGGSAFIWEGEYGELSHTDFYNDGAAYSPGADKWTPLPITPETPGRRTDHTAVWTGREMIVWGGASREDPAPAGGRYVEAGNTWKPLPTEFAPHARHAYSIIWTGAEMAICGGFYTTPSDWDEKTVILNDVWFYTPPKEFILYQKR
jgi:N-acetylneuraminic acid mutarotase